MRKRRAVLQALFALPLLSLLRPEGAHADDGEDEPRRARKRNPVALSQVGLKRGDNDLGPSPQTLEREAADLQVVSTTAETALLTYTVPGFTLDGDAGIRVDLRCGLKNNKGTAGDIIWRIKYGATTLYQETRTYSDAANRAPFVATFTLRAKSSAAAQELDGMLIENGRTSAPTTGEGGLSSASVGAIYGTSAEDAETPLDLTVTCQLNASNANFYVTRRWYLIELL